MQTAPYGSWKSPITADQIATSGVSLTRPLADGEDVYWAELRPSEGGRTTVVRMRDGERMDCVPAPFNVRTRAHEYGGAAYLADDGIIYFSNYADQRLYRVIPGDAPVPVTPEASVRYADGITDRKRGRILCVREDHSADDREAVNTLVAIDPDANHTGDILASGSDFYAAPRLSPDGSRLAWLSWNHPAMPWDAAELWTADVCEDGSLGDAVKIVGGPSESVHQPEWSPSGELVFASDRSNWWNLYAWRDGKAVPLVPMDAEFAYPAWQFGLTEYAFVGPSQIVCGYCRDGLWAVGLVDTNTGEWSALDLPFTSVLNMAASESHALFIGGRPTGSAGIVRLDPTTGEFDILRRASTLEVVPDFLADPEPVDFPTESGLTAHALFYAPKNPDFAAPPNEKPPLVVMIHGGPTAATKTSLRLDIQYYTSRGIAVLDVNYGGSTGYGREYRERLYGEWGVVDVDDCCNGARYMAQQGRVDPARMAITGGSAGGYTTLAALAFRDVFAAGASHFGVSDCSVLAEETHKFESRYLDTLIGPYPERRDLYDARSPIKHLDKLDRPVIFLQGLEDEIVPPNQAERMFDALRERGVPTAYLPFEGEQHGFRQSANIRRALEAELYFFGRIFGFTPADDIEPVPIENM